MAVCARDPHTGPSVVCFVQVFAAIVRHVDWDIVRCLVIAGPGFAKDEFREYLDKGGPPIGCTS